jgi:hypothetical protein
LEDGVCIRGAYILDMCRSQDIVQRSDALAGVHKTR